MKVLKREKEEEEEEAYFKIKDYADGIISATN
jgi:hypothetical protein